jgi:calcium-dependent protein kinase
MYSIMGTCYYIAPEILDGHYTKAVDMWSLGVIMFIMLSGNLPFNGSDTMEVFNNIKAEHYDFSAPEFNKISKSAKDLISLLIIKNPE